MVTADKDKTETKVQGDASSSRETEAQVKAPETNQETQASDSQAPKPTMQEVCEKRDAADIASERELRVNIGRGIRKPRFNHPYIRKVGFKFVVLKPFRKTRYAKEGEKVEVWQVGEDYDLPNISRTTKNRLYMRGLIGPKDHAWTNFMIDLYKSRAEKDRQVDNDLLQPPKEAKVEEPPKSTSKPVIVDPVNETPKKRAPAKPEPKVEAKATPNPAVKPAVVRKPSESSTAKK